MAVGSGQGLRFTYKIGCTGEWFMMKISAATSMQLLPAHKHKQMNSSQHCIRCLDCCLYVASAIDHSKNKIA